MKILNIDDNAENRYLIEVLGQANGFEVVSARNGLEALEILNSQPVDLIVSDVLMPEMDGFQLCHEVKSRERTRNIPFIFYTATYTAEKDAELGMSLGASRYVLKPVEPDEFMTILGEVISEAQKGELAVPEGELKGTVDYLKAYTARLVHKLDRKIEQLDDARNELQASLTARDSEIAQRKRAEEALAASEARFRSLLESAPQGVIAIDEQGHMAVVNASTEQTFGYTRNELLGQPVDLLLPERFRKAHLEHRKQYFSHPRTRTMGLGVDLWGRKKDGTEFPLEVSLSFVEEDGKKLALALVTDITERRRAEEHLRQAQKLESIGMLAGGIAHDFNNLLTVIAGYSGLLLQSIEEPDPARQQIKEIAEAAERATALTRQLLAFSRKQVLQPSNVDINGIVRDSEKMLKRLIGENIEVRLGLSADELRATVDPGQLVQVIMNLAVNARDAMPDGGVLTIETAQSDLSAEYAEAHPGLKPGAYVQLAISDNGTGMDRATLDRIFEPFFTTKGPGSGTGLGLSTVYGIVKQSNGRITVYSEPGHGATFRVYLPRIFEAPLAGAKPSVKPLRGTEMILLVEDDAALRRLTKTILVSAGYKVIEAANGGAALLVCEQHRGQISLMITDVIMPGMSGRELAGRLAPIRPEMNVLYMSGYTDRAVVTNGALDEGLAFLQKPFTPESLKERVRAILDRIKR